MEQETPKFSLAGRAKSTRGKPNKSFLVRENLVHQMYVKIFQFRLKQPRSAMVKQSEILQFWSCDLARKFILLAARVWEREAAQSGTNQFDEEREECVSEWCPNEVWCLFYLYTLLRVKRDIHWASWAYIMMKPTWTIWTCEGINSESHFFLSEWDDLYFNLGPLEKRNPMPSSSPSNELSKGGFWP